MKFVVKKLLLISHNGMTRKLIAGMIGNTFEIIHAEAMEGAVKHLAERPHVVILDTENGQGGNVGLFARLPLIVLAEEGEDENAVRQRLGARKATVLQKPILPDHLMHAVDAALGASEAIKRAGAVATKRLSPETPLKNRDDFMRRAIDLSQEKMDENCGGPFGAVIVRNGKIIGEGWNQVTSTNDPTAHAEMTAIRAAAVASGDFSLAGCEIYSSCEPCPMCLAAIYWARIDRVYFGCTREDAANIGFDDDFLYRELALPEERRTLPVKMILHDEARIVFDNWMRKKDKVAY